MLESLWELNSGIVLEERLYRKESGTEIGNSLEFDFVVPPPHS